MGTAQHWFDSSGWARIINLLWLVMLGVVVYFAVLFVLGFRAKDFSKRGRH